MDNGFKRRVYYKLTADIQEKLAEAGLPKADAEKLKPLIGKNHVFTTDFTAALSQALGEPAFTKHNATLVAACAKKGQGGAGGANNKQYMALLLAGVADSNMTPDPPVWARTDAHRKSSCHERLDSSVPPMASGMPPSRSSGMNRFLKFCDSASIS